MSKKEDNPYWTMDGKTRDKHIALGRECGFFDDVDFVEELHKRENSYGPDSLTDEEQGFLRIVKDPDALFEFAEESGYLDKQNLIDSGDSHKINTDRFLRIKYYENGVPDRTDGQYSDAYDKSTQPYEPTETILVYESVPKGDMHEFWRVGSESKDSFSVLVTDPSHYTVDRVLSDVEARLYNNRRNEFVNFFNENQKTTDVSLGVSESQTDFDVTD